MDVSLEKFKGLVTMYISPFSLKNDWKINWSIIPSNNRPPTLTQVNKTYIEIIRIVMSIGLIGGAQLSRFLDKTNPRTIRKIKAVLCRKQLLVGHDIYLNKKRLTLFTAGPNAAELVGVSRRENYWLRYDTEDVLKRLIFFELLSQFKAINPIVLPAPDPFTGALKLNGEVFNIYVTRGRIDDLLMHIKWEEKINGKMIIITEHLNYLKPLEAFVHKLNLRVTTDKELLNSKLSSMFFSWKDGEWINKVPS